MWTTGWAVHKLLRGLWICYAAVARPTNGPGPVNGPGDARYGPDVGASGNR
jgi:hypothetical protein